MERWDKVRSVRVQKFLLIRSPLIPTNRALPWRDLRVQPTHHRLIEHEKVAHIIGSHFLSVSDRVEVQE